MSESGIEYITTECPKGHRVRGDVGWLERDVCCPHCQTDFRFKRPKGTAVEVVAPVGSKLPENPKVSDTSVMKILGDFSDTEVKDDGTTRQCAECGATYPGYVDRCYNCNVTLRMPVKEPVGLTGATPPESIDFKPINPFPFDNVAVRKVMRPRKEIEFLEVDDSLSELLQEIRKTRRTRYVVCDRSLDTIVGLVHIEDIVLADESHFDIRKIVRPLDNILESTRISDTLLHLQKIGEPIALIVDEFETVIGMVTVKDVMLKLFKTP